MRKMLLYLTVMIAALSFAAPLLSQSIWLDRRHDKTVSVEVLIPNFKTEDEGSISGMLNVHQVDQSGFVFRLRGGPSPLINTNKDEFEDGTELFIGYSAQVGYESEAVSVLGGFTGRANLTESNSDFGDRSAHQIGFNTSVGLGKIKPGVHFRLPLDKSLKDALDFVFGLNLGVQL